ncbi:heavy-metal-associated domain-containing protein [Porphyrobacter sp. YT40]|uniref:heavy-metal-associated domain-containing protein n=1 Tax=Porphyrobacter sp. YT40 TaxID=2547601 RepID=UPI00114240BE|nr:heavy-metal-associated domain-containing protein [Porphyrobacter sp. YT40]QDH34393.1 heavy-metal-associated domain-containing protein [Porphyrobacter sp. YT40]
MRATLSLPGPAAAPSQALRRWLGGTALALALLGGGYALMAQVAGERGIAATAASADIEVKGISVDVQGKSAEDARAKGWREAQRKAWEKIKGPKISDSQLEGLVSAVVIEREQLGPRRYIATLGVVFDRQRASAYLGGAAQQTRSAPLLVIPVVESGGAYITFEQRNPWQRAWAEFNPGQSRISYVRLSGAGGDSLLVNFGQANRRSRTWWRSTLDQYGATDVLMAFARLDHQFPGGPVSGTFTARYGPDNRPLGSFTLEANTAEGLPAMLAQAVERMDGIFAGALAEGKLRPDPSLRLGAGGAIDPAIQRLLDIGRAAKARQAAEAAAAAAGLPRIDAQPVTGADAEGAVRSFTVQFATPDGAAFDSAITAVRGTSGVRGLLLSSTAIGGTSVMSVSYTGSLEELAAALEARGFAVRRGANALAISR